MVRRTAESHELRNRRKASSESHSHSVSTGRSVISASQGSEAKAGARGPDGRLKERRRGVVLPGRFMIAVVRASFKGKSRRMYSQSRRGNAWMGGRGSRLVTLLGRRKVVVVAIDALAGLAQAFAAGLGCAGQGRLRTVLVLPMGFPFQ